jgi:tryptophan synthase alpha subunit
LKKSSHLSQVTAEVAEAIVIGSMTVSEIAEHMVKEIQEKR